MVSNVHIHHNTKKNNNTNNKKMTIKGWAKRYMNTNMKITTTPTQKEQHQQHEKNNNINMTRSTI